MKRTLTASITVGVLASMGCGAAPDDGSLAGAELGEDSAAACTDPVYPSTSFNLAAAVAGQTTTNDGSYGSAACPGRYLVDLTNTTNRSFTSFADWGDVAGTATTCGRHYVTARMDGLLPPSPDYPLGRWTTVSADRTVVGKFLNGVCQNRLDLTAVQGLTPYTKVRIAARAYYMYGDGIVFQTPYKVTVGFKVTGNSGY